MTTLTPVVVDRQRRRFRGMISAEAMAELDARRPPERTRRSGAHSRRAGRQENDYKAKAVMLAGRICPSMPRPFAKPVDLGCWLGAVFALLTCSRFEEEQYATALSRACRSRADLNTPHGRTDFVDPFAQPDW